jgi:hypothetical protein
VKVEKGGDEMRWFKIAGISVATLIISNVLVLGDTYKNDRRVFGISNGGLTYQRLKTWFFQKTGVASKNIQDQVIC